MVATFLSLADPVVTKRVQVTSGLLRVKDKKVVHAHAATVRQVASEGQAHRSVAVDTLLMALAVGSARGLVTFG